MRHRRRWVRGRGQLDAFPNDAGEWNDYDGDGVGDNSDAFMTEVMIDLAKRDITMIVVTHEMGFAKEVADRCILFDEGHLIEENTPEEFFSNPKHDRTKLFLEQIL